MKLPPDLPNVVLQPRTQRVVDFLNAQVDDTMGRPDVKNAAAIAVLSHFANAGVVPPPALVEKLVALVCGGSIPSMKNYVRLTAAAMQENADPADWHAPYTH